MTTLFTIFHLLLVIALAVLVSELFTRMRHSPHKLVRFVIGPAIMLPWFTLGMIDKLPSSVGTVGVLASLIFLARK